jgi:hypothetical protein
MPTRSNLRKPLTAIRTTVEDPIEFPEKEICIVLSLCWIEDIPRDLTADRAPS